MHNIAVLPGDGIGPEVLDEVLKVIRAAAEKTGFNYKTVNYDFGADRYAAEGCEGDPLPDSALSEFRDMDAIYLGAIGDESKVPRGVLEKGILLKIRFELDQYINLRPIKLYPGVLTPLRGKGPKDIDFIVVRENTEGLYAGIGGFLKKGTPDEVAVQEMVNTYKGVKRCIRHAFDLTRDDNKRKKLTLCDKSNVLTFAHDLWQRVFEEVGKEYPDVEQDNVYVDAMTMRMVKNPEWLDVIVVCNMFGDIITDLGAELQGGMGIAASGNINPNGVSMFEPIHGSAPKYKRLNVANPLAAICAAGMMLDHLGEKEAAKRVDNAIATALASGKIKSLSAGKMGLSTTEMGDLIAGLI